ncbi:MAG: tRNA (guanosine(37)-N1)-methyltransferase TrmD [Bdellovibrionales bacterium]|nr:tRNA (guanosine(37)-N1)-methyltransferase TrmD [Bdellovibrionales bacterium]
MKFHVVTIFPEFFESPMKVGVVGQAMQKGLISLNAFSPRAFTDDVHQTVDDRPFGGGDGMVMKVDPLLKSVSSISGRKGPLLVMSPGGRPFDTKLTKELALQPDLTIVCGRYAGIDQRFVDMSGAVEVSVGDYVVSGGEPAALCVLDAVTRLVPGVLGHPDSAEQDSFFEGLLESPTYTRPQEYQGRRVPDFLLSGDHSKIENKRYWMSLLRTAGIRPDLLTEQHHSALTEAKDWLATLSVDEVRGLGLENLLERNEIKAGADGSSRVQENGDS